MTGCLKVSRCPVKCVKDVLWHQQFSICIYFNAIIHMFRTVMGYITKEYVAMYVLWDIANLHNAIIMHCSCSNLGICVYMEYETYSKHHALSANWLIKNGSPPCFHK